MRREQLRIALEAAAKLGHHHKFVIAGSLSVLGLKEVPPEMMSMSIDIDFFPLNDPTHVQEITEALGEDSEFHESNGYYLDPISVDILVLPQGWRERLVELQLGSVQAYFLDVNDTAISKLVRSAENDFRWVDAGLEAGLLDIDVIDARSQFNSIDYPGDDDKRRVRNGITALRAAVKDGETLSKELLTFLRARPECRIANLIDDSHQYQGSIVFAGDNRAVQAIGDDTLVIHDSSEWPFHPEVGQEYIVDYEDSKSTISSSHSLGT